jgi:hypothetical protein
MDADRRCKSLYLKAASYEFLVIIGRRFKILDRRQVLDRT